MTATPRVKCEACGGKCHKLLGTGSGIIFKGSGFYETDYKEKKGKPPASATKSEKKDNGKSASESKSGGSGGASEKKASGTAAKS
jgi:predicted nucleic acid-binding Zn ribbon protein